MYHENSPSKDSPSSYFRFQNFVRGCQLLGSRGIRCEIGVIIGLPGDNEESIWKTIEFVGEGRLGHLSAYRLQVLPGSTYARRADSLGILFDQSPPYFVNSTETLSANTLNALEQEVDNAVAFNNEKYRQLLAEANRDRFAMELPTK